MTVGEYHSFDDLANELLTLIDDEGRRFGEIWRLVRQLEVLRRDLFGIGDDRSIWDGCGVRFEDHALVLLTYHPNMGDCHEARIDHYRKLSDDEENELRDHLRTIIKAWLRYSKTLPDTEAEEWVNVKLADCEQDRGTIGDHAKKKLKPYIRKVSHGRYQIQRAWLPEYIKPDRLDEYQ